MGEECKVAIRSIRRDAMEKFKAMKKNNEITEDDLKDCEDEIQTSSLRKLTVTLPRRKKRYSLSKLWQRMRK